MRCNESCAVGEVQRERGQGRAAREVQRERGEVGATRVVLWGRCNEREAREARRGRCNRREASEVIAHAMHLLHPFRNSICHEILMRAMCV